MNEAAEDLRQALASAHRRLTAQDARLRELELVLSSISTIRADGGASVVWDRTFSLLRSALDFNLAVVLESSQGEFVCSASSNCALIGARWPSGPLFQRVASGNGAVAPDISRLPEWASGDPRASVGSVGAVLAPIVAHEGNGLLVLCGARHGEYAVSDLALVLRLGLIVSHSLAADRQRALADAIRIAELERKAAVQANSAKSQFFANMSHELRTPMNGVLTVADLLRRSALDDQQTEMVELIQSSGRMLQAILNDVLDFSKIESGRLELDSHPFDLSEDLAPIFHLYQTRADEQGLVFTIEDRRASSPSYSGDSLRVRQVVSNLLSNAFKFTTEGSVTLVIDAEPQDMGSRVTISVRDTGIGLSDEAMARLFDRFEQADKSTTRKYGGTGLGLAISRELAQLMDGDIYARQVAGGGALFDFTFCLPIAEGGNAADLDPFLEAPPSVADLRILVAEDNPNNRRIVELILGSVGAEVSFAENGKDACELIESRIFDAVLMDLQMPVMDGLTAIRKLRVSEAANGRPRLPIIAVSANAMTHHVDEALKAGADAHVAKPIDAAALFTQIASLCGAR